MDFEAESWPVTDEEGYYQSYKENGKFVNWWHKDMPSFVQILDGWDIKARYFLMKLNSPFGPFITTSPARGREPQKPKKGDEK